MIVVLHFSFQKTQRDGEAPEQRAPWSPEPQVRVLRQSFHRSLQAEGPRGQKTPGQTEPSV